MPKYVDVALPVPLRQRFSYLLPDELLSQAGIGSRVKVPFGKQHHIGIVLNITPFCELDESRIKPVTELLDTRPLLPESLARLCDRAAKYYFTSHGQMLSQAMPVSLRKGADSEFKGQSEYCLTETGKQIEPGTLRRSPAQKKLLETLRQQNLTSAEFNELALSKSALKVMTEKAWVESKITAAGFDLNWRTALTLSETPHRLNSEQAVAVAALTQQQGFKTTLIEGVTGSGKTEVYLAVIENILKQGRQALVLVPEIGLTPQTIGRFRRRFDVTVSVIHSGLTDKQRLIAWQQAREGEAAIIIGTRSALFTPMKYPGIIILDEEHDSSFKQQEGVGYHARDLAVMRGQLERIPTILGSATPSLETLSNALSERYQHLQLTGRAGAAQKIRQGIIDIRNQPLKAGLSTALINEIRIHLDAGNQVLLFLNRRGYAPALLCHECGHLHECDRCDAFFTLHQSLGEIRCHHCGNQYAIPKQCHQCGSTMLAGQGLGTEQLEQALRQLFPKYPVVRIDRDSTRRKGSLESHLNAIHKGEYRILVGTQMLAKGHHFPDVTLVGLLDVDGALFSADFRAPERFGQLYTQVAGRAGRAAKPGTVLLQTRQADNPVLREILYKGYAEFARGQLEERKQALLPPAWNMVLVKAQAHNPADAEALLAEFRLRLPQNEHCEVIGPMPAPMDKKAGKFRRQLMFQTQTRPMMQRVFERVLAEVEQLAVAKRCRWSVDRDPQDLI